MFEPLAVNLESGMYQTISETSTLHGGEFETVTSCELARRLLGNWVTVTK